MFSKTVLIFSSLFLFLQLSACSVKRSAFIEGRARAAVATDDQQATDAAEEILKQGGNLVDAAVVNPQTNSIAGGGFLLFHDGKASKTRAWDFREVAPMRATADMYLESGEVIPNASVYGAKAVAVPGLVAGLYEFHRAHGKLSWVQVLAPAVRLAYESRISANFSRHILENASGLQADSYLKEKFIPFGKPLKAGAVLRQPELAHTLEGISNGGRDYFYKGEFARKLSAWMKEEGGIIEMRDLAAYEPQKRWPIDAKWQNYRVLSMPPPSSGGIHLVQILRMMDKVPSSFRENFSDEKVSRSVLRVEAFKRAFSDRSVHLGDPGWHRTPVGELLDEKYLQIRANEIASGIKASSEVRPLDLKDKNTTHLSFVDSKGNAISLTQTSNGWFGARVVVPGTGVLLNNEMDDFVIKPGVKNMWGLVGGSANQIAPRKRPLSSMSPTIVLDEDDLPILVAGSRGGARIITSTANIIYRVLAEGVHISEALPECRFHHQWSPDEVLVEKGCMREFKALKKYYTLKEGPIFGSVEVVGARPDGRLYSSPDPRSHTRPLLVE